MPRAQLNPWYMEQRFRPGFVKYSACEDGSKGYLVGQGALVHEDVADFVEGIGRNDIGDIPLDEVAHGIAPGEFTPLAWCFSVHAKFSSMTATSG